MYTNNELTIRPIKEGDLYRVWELVYKEKAPEWKKWDAPYYPHTAMTYDDFIQGSDSWVDQDDYWAIEVNDSLTGVVTYSWEHLASNWLEVGIVLFPADKWGKGIGTRALKLWIDHLFNTLPLVRLGFSTWSGNKRMMRVGEKLNMQIEARIRKARYYNGEYYDSIKMGILREEWESIRG